MTRSTPPKKGAGEAPPPAAPAEGLDYRIADIYERLDRANRSASMVEVAWTPARRPAEVAPPAPVAPELRGLWPSDPLPAKALRPRGGHGAATAEGATVMFVTLFSLSPDLVREAVRRIERQQRSARNFRPVFLTDAVDSTPFRHAGYTHEYFPPAIYGAPEQAAQFQDRFLRLWRKWKGGLLIDFSPAGFLASRIEGLDSFINRGEGGKTHFNPRLKKTPPPRRPTTDVVALRAEYLASGLAEEPDSFVLYRILGNDLPPRHEVGQTLTNLRFMLEHEPPLPGCEKRWVVNRVVDPEQEAAIIALLTEHGQSYLHIPFVLEEYARAGWDLASFPDEAFFLRGRYGEMDEYDQLRAQAHVRRFKNNYLINNNGARNAALRDGRGRAKWVLPWDGNCFLTEHAWAEITDAVRGRPYLKYFTVPMSRTLDNADLLIPGYRPVADEEPQILFRRDAREEFDGAFYYGRRPKVELFYRLGIPGKWDDWPDDIWDLPRAPRSPDAGTTGEAGWVARLFSGQTQLEADKVAGLRSRGEARIAAITQMLDRLDVAALDLRYRPEALVAYDEAAIGALPGAAPGSPEDALHQRLIQEAELALQRGPHSVVEKTSRPPSGDPHDYYHPAPYWWPNPSTPTGMPFIFRDGERIPGTRLYEPESARYDRTRLQRMFDDSTVLALGWLASGDDRYIDHAARLVRTWFLDPATRMNPHLLYSQVRSQTIHDIGAKSGLIEMKDLYYLLDAVRLIERAGRFSEDEKAAFRTWLREYLEWLQTSQQGVEERLTNNNHGTCYDLQTGSIAAFLGERELLERTFFTSRERILEQFTKDGRQPHEMKRTQTAHYCCFNLQCWINLATLADSCGHDLWSFEGPDGRGLARAFAWLLPHLAQKTWKYEQIEPFDRGRFLPLFFAARDRIPDDGTLRMTDAAQARPLFFPHDGIKPFWMLSRPAPGRPRTEAWSELADRLRKLEQPVFDLCHAADRPAPEEGDARELDKKLWGGFSAPARAALAAIRDNPEADPKERTRAARLLARWAFTAGDLADTLAQTDAMLQLGAQGERERALLRACCLERQGQPAAAAAAIETPLSLFSRDAGLCLAMANIMQHPDAPGAADGAWTDWVNRIYRHARLPDLLGPGGAGLAGWLRPATATPGALPPPGTGARVSVILVVPPGAAHLDAALDSILGQSWQGIEVIAADISGEPATARRLTKRAAGDPRLRRLALPAGTPEAVARNAALAEATGDLVTRHEADEIAHPWRIALQVEALQSGEGIGTLVQGLRVGGDGRVIAGWTPDFGYVADAPGSLLLPTATLRAQGGWDTAPGAGDAVLLWRLRRPDEAAAPRTIFPGVPLSVRVGVSAAPGQPTHLEFPYGRPRLLFRSLLRRERAAAALADPSDPPRPVPPLLAEGQGGEGPFDVVFLGDFSVNATAIEQVRLRVLDAVAAGQKVALFHWPDGRRSWKDELDDSLAEAVDAGRLAQVAPFEAVAAGRVVLCNPYLLAEPVDGLPALAPERLEVLFGPELHLEEFDDGSPRRPPSAAAIERFFDRPFNWTTI